MAKVGMVLHYGTELDLAPIRSGMAEVNKIAKQNPLDLKVLSTGSMETRLGDAQNFFHTISQGTENIERLSVTMTEFRDKAGNTFLVPTKAVEKLAGATSTTKDTVIKLNDAYIKTGKAIDGWTATGKAEKATIDLGAAARKAEADANALAKGLDADVKAADRFLAKSANMSGRQVEEAKKVALALKAEKAEFDKLFGATNRDWDAINAKGQKVKQLAVELDRVKQSTNAGANAFQNWGERISNAIKQTVSYALSIKLVQEAQQLFNQAVRYAIDLNTEMTKIQVLQAEGAKTPEEINSLAQSFNTLGQQMGASTLEVAKGSVEWLRQGRTIEETEKLLVSSLQLAKLGAMDSADATNYLTSITNAFGISAEKAATVVDKLIAVDNIAATSAGELATALRYTSESGAIAGVTMEQLVSYIGTVSTVTRQNAEMIGQAFKTMFARMTQIQGGGLDETGQSISKVEAALAKVNIEIKNADGSWLGMGDVLEQVAAKWTTLTTREQTEIATAVAGVRQKEAFLVLMNNMDKALAYQAAQVDSLGLANERYGIYLESVQAKQGKLKAQLEELFTKTINSDTIKNVLDLASAFLQLVDNIGGLGPILIIVTGLLVAFRSLAIISLIKSIPELIVGLLGTAAAQAGLTASTFTLSAAFGALNLAMGPVGWTILGIGAAIAAVGGIIALQNKALADQQKSYDNAAKAVQDYQDKMENLTTVVSGARDSINELNAILGEQEKKGRLTEDQQGRVNDIFRELYEILPNLPWKFTDGSPYLDKTTLSALNLKKALEELYAIQSPGVQAFKTNAEGQIKIYNDAGAAIDVAIGKQKAFQAMQEAEVKTIEEAEAAINSVDTTGWSEAMIQGLQQAGSIIYENRDYWTGSLTDGFSTALTEGLSSATQDVAKNKLAQTEISNSLAQSISQSIGKKDDVNKAYMDYLEALANNGNKFIRDALDKAWAEFNKQHARGLAQSITAANRTRARVPIIETEEDKLARQNKEYEKALALVDRLTPAITKLNTALKSGNIASIESAVTDLNVELVKLGNETGLEAPIKQFDDLDNAAHTALDPELVKNYRNELIAWLKEAETLGVTSELQLNMVRNQIAALGGATTEAIDKIGVSISKVKEFSQSVGNELWQLADATDSVLTDTNGNILQSSEQVVSALENHMITFDQLISQMSSLSTNDAAKMKRYIEQLINYLNGKTIYIPVKPVFEAVERKKTSGGGGGGSAPPNPRIKEIEDEVKALNKRKEALQDQLKDFQDYINLQKESLQRSKEEADFQDELTNKHKELGNIKARLAVLSLDNSEQAQQEREKLEEEAAKKEEDITKTTEDRKYNLQIQALDDLQKAFDDSIKAQLDAIDDAIDKLNEEKDALKDVASGGGGSWTELDEASERYARDLKYYTDSVITPAIQRQIDKLKTSNDEIKASIKNWYDLGIPIDGAITRLQTYLLALERLKSQHPEFMDGIPIVSPDNKIVKISWHEGGIVDYPVESHHDGNFAGNLMTNEVFGKLLKGEYVATEGQMNNFMRNILPKIATTGIVPKIQRNENKQQQTGDIILDVDINVAGSLDKTVVPNIEKGFMKIVNKALEIKGIRRTAGNFTI